MKTVSDFLRKQLLVLEFNSKQLLVSLFSKKGKVVLLENYAMLDNSGSDFNSSFQLIIERLSSALKQKISNIPCIVILPEDFIYEDVITIPKVSFFKQKKITNSHMQQFFGLQPASTVFNSYPLFKGPAFIRAIACVQQKKIMDNFYNKLFSLPLNIISVQTPLRGFFNFLYIEPPKDSTVYVKITTDAIQSLLLMKDDLYVASSSLRNIKENGFHEIVEAVAQSYYQLQRKVPSVIPQQCAICAHSGIDRGLLMNLLRGALSLPVGIVSMPVTLQHSLENEVVNDFAGSIGAAYQYFKLSNSGISQTVTPARFSVRSVLQRNKNKLAFVLCSVASAVIFLTLHFKNEGAHYQAAAKVLEGDIAAYKAVLKEINFDKACVKEKQDLLNQIRKLKSPTVFWINFLSQLDQVFHAFDSIWISTLQTVEADCERSPLEELQTSFVMGVEYREKRQGISPIPPSIKIQGSFLLENGREDEALDQLKRLMNRLGQLKTSQSVRDFSMNFRNKNVVDFALTLDTFHAAAL